MSEETKEMLQRVLLSCVPEGMQRVVECHDHGLERVKIQIQDRRDPAHRAVYRFMTDEGRFTEQTGITSYKSSYDPEEFVKTLERYSYLVTVKVA